MSSPTWRQNHTNQGRGLWQSSERQCRKLFCYSRLHQLIPTLFVLQKAKPGKLPTFNGGYQHGIYIHTERNKKERNTTRQGKWRIHTGKLYHKSVWDYDQTSSWKLKKANVIWLQREEKNRKKKIRSHKRKTWGNILLFKVLERK